MRLMTGKRAGTLLEMMHPIERFTLARAWDGLTDEEFFWEPFPTAWSIRRRDQCRTPDPFGAGEWVADFAIPEPAPVPVTTIAWLYWHIGSLPRAHGHALHRRRTHRGRPSRHPDRRST
jgi:hypothetical protein